MALPRSCRPSCENGSGEWPWCWQDVVGDAKLYRFCAHDTTSTIDIDFVSEEEMVSETKLQVKV